MRPLPTGAYPIHQARLYGKRPDELVLVSTVGGLPNEGNPVVVFPVGEDPRHFDWRWALGLEVLVVFDEQTKLTARVIARLLLDQKHKGLAQAFLWRADKQRGWVVMEGVDYAMFNMTVSEHRAFAGLGQ
jgi:hypothetical protein